MSLLILLGTVVAIGMLFFRVVRPFLLPLLLAGVLAVLFRPVHLWATRMFAGRRRLAAALVTLGILAAVLIPLAGVLTLAGMQLLQAGQGLVSTIELPENAQQQAGELLDAQQNSRLASAVRWIEGRLTEGTAKQVREFSASALLGVTKTLYEKTMTLAGDLIASAIGLVVMILALYYFLADGEALLAEVQRLSPLQDSDEHDLFHHFERICRGVVLGTVVAALVQGLLAAIGMALIGVERIWLLAVLTMFFSFIPFLGAAAVWSVVTVALILEQRYGAAVFLGVYGTIVISGSDNLIRAYLIHDRAQMHPLIALVTVLGAIQLVGLWGIFVGPISAAFFYALLKMLHRRLVETSDELDPAEGASAETGERTATATL
ncbi:MAG: AI-2E family transporter [Planctomycetota bacterium]|nr:MAG: AI-2E family transporter [Planctomycetota bacterium]REK39835.1 MAG: AI-2E family transporter [Planctomycetota bacterium]